MFNTACPERDPELKARKGLSAWRLPGPEIGTAESLLQQLTALLVQDDFRLFD